jgi:HAMP domain-containing protein
VTRWLAKVRPTRLAPRLLAAIFLASSALALVATGVQLYGDYRNELDAIDEELAQIERSTVGGLVNSVWSYNETQIRLTLVGLLQVRDVEHVEVRAGADETFSAGKPGRGRTIERTFALREPANPGALLGTLYVQVGLDGVYKRLYERALLILAAELAKAFLLALFILYVVDRWVTRHLEHMAAHARNLRLDRLDDEPLRLRRRTQPGDELDQVASALNDMSRELNHELERRAAADAERERLFLAYEHNRWLLQSIIDNTPAAIFVRDQQSRFQLVNPR